MTSASWLYIAVVLGAIACHDATRPGPGTGNPKTPAIVIAPGEEGTVVYGSDESKRLGIQLAAGDTVDIGLWVVPGSDLSDLQLRQGGTTLPLGTPTVVSTYQATAGSTIYSGIVVPKSGTYVFEVTGYWAYCPGGPPGYCTADGTFIVRVRKSAPILLVSSNWFHRAVFAEPDLSTLLDKEPISYRTPESESVVDTIWVRNIGAGTAAFGVAAKQWLTVPPSTAVNGPSTGWTVEQGAVPLVLRKNGSLPPGAYVDTLTYTGFPDDAWNQKKVTSSPLTLLVHEERGVRHPVTVGLAAIARNEVGEIFAGFETIYRLDGQGTLVPFKTLPGNLLSEGGFAFGPDTALYAVVFVRSLPGIVNSLYRIDRDGAMASIVPQVPGKLLAVLPDLSMYFVAPAENIMTRRSPAGEMQQVLSYLPDPAGTLPSSFRGLLFNPVDSALYWMRGTKLTRRDLRTGTETTLGDFGTATPIYVDASGHLFLRTPLGSNNYINFITIVDRDGTLIGRRYPPALADRIVVRGDTIFGSTSNAYWILPP